MYDQAKDLLDALKAMPDSLDGVLRDLTQEHADAFQDGDEGRPTLTRHSLLRQAILHASRGGDEGWSVVEVVCHLRDAEERTIERVRAMRDQDDPFLPGYDQEQWARDRHYAQANMREALAVFVRLRAGLVADLALLDAAGWVRTGRHEEQGTITIANLAIHIVAHDAVHCAQLARQLRG